MSGNKFQQRSKALIDRTYVAHRISLIQEVVAIGDDILLRLKKNQERGHRGPTECHELPLSTSSGSVHLFFECTLLRGVGTRILARDTEEESSGYSVVEYLFAPIGLLREASAVVEGTRDESDSKKSIIRYFWRWKRSITMVASKGIEMMEFVLLIGLLSVCNNVLRILRFVIRVKFLISWNDHRSIRLMIQLFLC